MTGIDPLDQPPARLRLMAMLSAVSEAEFATLRDRLDVSDSVLSKHISTLADASYVKSRKGSHLGRRTTWVGSGRAARTRLPPTWPASAK